MEEVSANPIVMALLFIGRCLVPVALMLGISYLLRRFGLIQAPPELESPPEVEGDSAEEETSDVHA